LAEWLLSTLEDRFDAAAFKDEHRERVMALIESKAQGKPLELPKPKRKRAERSLVKALEQSLRRAKEPRVA
jgi:DNA end-binding protein Ku